MLISIKLDSNFMLQSLANIISNFLLSHYVINYIIYSAKYIGILWIGCMKIKKFKLNKMLINLKLNTYNPTIRLKIFPIIVFITN